MKVHVRCTGTEHSQSLVEYAKRRVYQHLSRFGHRLEQVDVRLSDINGPKGGCDKRCLAIARGPGLRPLRIESLHADFYGCVELAVERLGEAVGRGIARRRERLMAVAEGGAS